MTRLKALFFAPVLVLATLGPALFTVGCKQLSPEEKVAQMRSRYEATVNTGGFVVVPHAPEFTEPPVDDIGEVDATGGEGEETAEEEVVAEPTGFDVTLDMVVVNRNDETLDQLTIDIVHTDGSQNEKARYQATIDASGIYKGGNSQVAHTLENIPYIEGDGFYTEVRHPVPDAEKSKYPELANAGQ